MPKINNIRTIIESAHLLEGGGFPVARPFPIAGNLQCDPFLLLDHFGPINWAPGEALGAPDHPHRGFETITYLIEGTMIHKDSGGNQAQMGPGEAQWMVVGSGLVHSEMPPEEFKEKGGLMHGFQLWVNLASDKKMMHPAYKNILKDQIPKIDFGKGWLKVIGGEIDGTLGPAQPNTPIGYGHLHLEAGATWSCPVPPDWDAACYPFSGAGLFGLEESMVPKDRLVCFGEGDQIQVKHTGSKPLDCLILLGKALKEPIKRHGPFVMNNVEQIEEAIRDYQSGKMGSITPDDLSEA